MPSALTGWLRSFPLCPISFSFPDSLCLALHYLQNVRWIIFYSESPGIPGNKRVLFFNSSVLFESCSFPELSKPTWKDRKGITCNEASEGIVPEMNSMDAQFSCRRIMSYTLSFPPNISFGINNRRIASLFLQLLLLTKFPANGQEQPKPAPGGENSGVGWQICGKLFDAEIVANLSFAEQMINLFCNKRHERMGAT